MTSSLRKAAACMFVVACGPTRPNADAQPRPAVEGSVSQAVATQQTVEPLGQAKAEPASSTGRVALAISVPLVERALSDANIHLIRQDADPNPHYYRVTYWYSEEDDLSILFYDGALERQARKRPSSTLLAGDQEEQDWVHACSLGPRQFVCLEASSGPRGRWIAVAKRLAHMSTIGTTPIESVQSLGFDIDRPACKVDGEPSKELTLQHYISAFRGSDFMGIAVLDFSKAAADAETDSPKTAIRTGKDKLLIVSGTTTASGGIQALADRLTSPSPEDR